MRPAVPVAVLLAGLLLVGAGAAGHVQGRKCETVAYMSVSENASAAPPDAPRVAYADLTDRQRAVFDRGREAAQGALVRRGIFPDTTVVRRDDESYLVYVTQDRGCAPFDPVTVGAPLIGGGALTLLGGTVLYLGRPE